MFYPRNYFPFSKEYHTITCDKYKVVYNVEVVDGEDRPIVMGKKEF